MTQLADKIIKLHKEGKSYRQIQTLLKCSKGTIAYHLGVGQKEKTAGRKKKQLTKIRQYIQQYKQDRSCVDCGENYPYWIMDFDHLHDKSFNISNHRNYTNDLELIKLEIAKCEVVCSNCHRNRTYNRNIQNGNGSIEISQHYE